MNVNFLLGSGISQNMLNTDVDKITSSLENDFWISRNNLYYKVDSIDNESEIVKNYKAALEIVKNELVNSTELSETDINYEHIYYIFDQVKNLRESAKTNHLAHKHISEISEKCSSYSVNEFGEDLEFIDFSNRILTYIDSVVFNHLVFDSEVDSLIPIFDQFKGRSIKSYIFSLNHDLLIEKYFQNRGISFNDFFESGEHPLRKFSISSVGNIEAFDFGLFKLHGSINWVRSTKRFFDYYTIDDFTENLLLNFPFLSNGISTVKISPEFLTGHTNKSVDYFHGVYSFLVTKFIEVLNETDVLIISGFGWQDYVIRGIVIEWLDYDRSRKMILCYENDEDPRNFLGMRIDHPQIVNTGKWLSDIDFEDMEEHLET